MKVKEFRIGNLGIDREGRICQVEELGINGEVRMAAMKGGLTSSPVELIPITEEWLVKLGFEKDDNKSFYFIILEEYNLEVMINGFSGTLDKEPNWFCSVVSYYSKTTLTKMYIHQLQNLFHALTGEELKLIS